MTTNATDFAPRMTLPPGPRFSLFSKIGYLRDPISLFSQMKDKYGDPFCITTSAKTVFTADPAGVKQIFTSPTDCFLPLQVEAQKQVLGKAFTGHSGAEHRRQRALLAPGLRTDALHRLAGQMVNAARLRMETWHLGQSLDLVEEGMAIALEIIIRALFSVHDRDGIEKRKKAVRAFSEQLSNKLFLFTSMMGLLHPAVPSQGKFIHVRQQFQDLLLQTIADIRADPGNHDGLLAHMVLAKRDDGSPAFADIEMADNMITMLIAGHETSALSFGWAVQAVLGTPEVYDKLMSELADVDLEVNPNAVHNLPYMNAVIKEVLRFWTPVPDVLRLVAKPVELMGYSIPEGTQVCACVWLTHFDPNIYENPWDFNPGRFLDRRYTAFEYYPFGGGERVCVGNTFAPMELKVLLATVLKTCRIELKDNKFPTLLRTGFLLGPKTPLRATYHGRLL
ncbi:ptzM [Candidatus Endolissoclinum faulkneri L5]|uniref:PtzM n=1 Tax=Candidatus Endolissoclinum faulkneri L5 TaxID=1401328 RepID=V9TTF6_9PROT|nr:cytochrome P450 [Candidatus Endolissoclinum faulkneri]AHC73881.1 ptzM [Candidatus Endolissoclinum faulkneri L5]